ncbi:MAG: hypothetical protein RL459_1939 [Pseudomonadota bacterium]
MTRTSRSFTDELKREAVKLVKQPEAMVNHIAWDLGIEASALRRRSTPTSQRHEFDHGRRVHRGRHPHRAGHGVWLYRRGTRIGMHQSPKTYPKLHVIERLHV